MEVLDNSEYNENVLLKLEYDKKSLELENLKNKNKHTKIMNIFKVCMIVLLFVVEIYIAFNFLKKYNFLDEKDNTVISSENFNIPILDINKELTMPYVNSLIKQLDEYKEDKSIKEILIIMNCPGGSPVAADEFTFYIKNYNKTKKINMYVQTMAASGGYYIASAIKPIVANPNAIVGSIGVIMPKYTIKKLADTIGVEEDNIVVGNYKVPATLFANVTNEQRDYLKNNMLLPTYENFVKVVADNRELPKETIESVAQGKIFIANKEEIKNVLVDKIANLVDFKNEIIATIIEKEKISKDKIKFIKKEESTSKFPSFKINLDLNNLVEGNSLNLK